jgi:hypothetical protein
MISSRRLFAALLLALATSLPVWGFDIAVYFDARSGVNYRSQNSGHKFCGDWVNGDRATVLNRIQTEDTVFALFKEMAVTHIITYYPFADDWEALHERHLQGMKILNWSYPAEAFDCGRPASNVF